MIEKLGHTLPGEWGSWLDHYRSQITHLPFVVLLFYSHIDHTMSHSISSHHQPEPPSHVSLFHQNGLENLLRLQTSLPPFLIHLPAYLPAILIITHGLHPTHVRESLNTSFRARSEDISTTTSFSTFLASCTLPIPLNTNV